jgi:hypothetical protein
MKQYRSENSLDEARDLMRSKGFDETHVQKETGGWSPTEP